MLFLAGLMGMVLVGATVFVGIGDGMPDGPGDRANTGDDAPAATGTAPVVPLGDLLTVDAEEAPMFGDPGDGSLPDQGGAGTSAAGAGQERPSSGAAGPFGGDEASHIVDFDLAEDTLVVLYDDSDLSTQLELELRPDPDDERLTQVLLDGHKLTSLHDVPGLTIDDIRLVPQSAAGLLMQVAA